MQPIELFESGQVLRWHHQPQMNRRLQTNADHQWGVAAIVFGITKGKVSRDLLLHCLFHDAGERRTGDLSAHFKRENPGIANLHKAAEAIAADAMTGGLPNITAAESLILKAADLMEAMLTILLFGVHPGKVEGWTESTDRVTKIGSKVPEVYDWADKHLNPLIMEVLGSKHLITPF